MGVDLRRKSTATPTTYTAVTASNFFSGSLGLLALCPYATFALQPPSINLKAELKYVVVSRVLLVVVRVRVRACACMCMSVWVSASCVCVGVRTVRRCDLVIDSRVSSLGRESTLSATAGGDALSESGSQWLRESLHALTCRVLAVPFVRQPRTTACAWRTRCCRRPLRLRCRRPSPCQRRRRHRRPLRPPQRRPRRRHPRPATTARAAPSTHVPALARAPPTSCTPTPPPPRVRVHACMPATQLCVECVCVPLTSSRWLLCASVFVCMGVLVCGRRRCVRRCVRRVSSSAARAGYASCLFFVRQLVTSRKAAAQVCENEFPTALPPGVGPITFKNPSKALAGTTLASVAWTMTGLPTDGSAEVWTGAVQAWRSTTTTAGWSWADGSDASTSIACNTRGCGLWAAGEPKYVDASLCAALQSDVDSRQRRVMLSLSLALASVAVAGSFFLSCASVTLFVVLAATRSTETRRTGRSSRRR
jgi:hypothetical protein